MPLIPRLGMSQNNYGKHLKTTADFGASDIADPD